MEVRQIKRGKEKVDERSLAQIAKALGTSKQEIKKAIEDLKRKGLAKEETIRNYLLNIKHMHKQSLWIYTCLKYSFYLFNRINLGFPKIPTMMRPWLFLLPHRSSYLVNYWFVLLKCSRF